MKRQYICGGYQIKNGQIIINHDESKVVRKIFELAVEDYSANAIAEYLNTADIPSFMKGKSWHHAGILAIIRNKNYTGENNYPRIIKISMFNEANEKFKFVSRKQKNGNHVLYEIVKCKTCGRPYRRYENDNSSIFWSCSKTMGNEARKCIKGVIAEKELVNIILNSINELIRNPKKIEMNPQTVKFHNEIEFKKKAADMQKALSRHLDVNTLLSLAQRKTQAFYEGYDEIDYQFRYNKLYQFLKDRPPYRRLDPEFLKQCVNEITIDMGQHILEIKLINNQTLTSEFHMLSCPE